MAKNSKIVHPSSVVMLLQLSPTVGWVKLGPNLVMVCQFICEMNITLTRRHLTIIIVSYVVRGRN